MPIGCVCIAWMARLPSTPRQMPNLLPRHSNHSPILGVLAVQNSGSAKVAACPQSRGYPQQSVPPRPHSLSHYCVRCWAGLRQQTMLRTSCETPACEPPMHDLPSAQHVLKTWRADAARLKPYATCMVITTNDLQGSVRVSSQGHCSSGASTHSRRLPGGMSTSRGAAGGRAGRHRSRHLHCDPKWRPSGGSRGGARGHHPAARGARPCSAS